MEQQYLNSILRYDSETGVLTWAESRGSKKIGDVAGSLTSQGYIDVGLDGRLVRAHILIWIMVFGKRPDGQIDHINGERSDNRLENLRDVSAIQNSQNIRSPTSRNSSGFLGVYYRNGKYAAQICTNYKVKHIGTFETPELAHEAYLIEKRKQHETCSI